MIGSRQVSTTVPAGGIAPETGCRRLGSGWRLAIVLAASVLVWRVAIDVIGGAAGPAIEDRTAHAIRAVFISATILPLLVVARRQLDRRSLAGIGLAPSRRDLKPFAFGAAVWLVAAVLGLLAMVVTGWGGIRISSFDGDAIRLALGLPLLALLYEALPEEILFRGYVYANLAERLPGWLAIVVQAALFVVWAAAIGAAGSVDRIVLFATFALTLGLLRAATGSVWACVGYHLAFQSVAQWLAAATHVGWLTIPERADFDVVVLWVFPIVFVGVALTGWMHVKGRGDSGLLIEGTR